LYDRYIWDSYNLCRLKNTNFTKSSLVNEFLLGVLLDIFDFWKFLDKINYLTFLFNDIKVNRFLKLKQTRDKPMRVHRSQRAIITKIIHIIIHIFKF